MKSNNTSINMPARKALSVKDFCLAYGVNRSKAFQLLSDGKLARYKLGRKTLIRVDDAEDWFVSLKQPKISRNTCDV